MGVASSIISIKTYAKRLNIETKYDTNEPFIYLRDSGFFRCKFGQGFLIGDIGKIGPDYIPGHGHADILSFELSLRNQRVLVNSGTSLYEESEERVRQRSTSSHNTVEIDGQSSSEVWKSFRVGRRAKPFDINIIKENGNYYELSCSHDGYKYLNGRNLHQRTWILSEGKLLVIDNIKGDYKKAVARFFVHPSVLVHKNYLLLPNNNCKVTFECSGGEICIVESSWHPEFGICMPSKCIEVNMNSSELKTVFNWS